MSDRGFLLTIIGDGRPLLAATGLGLVLAGSFGLFLAISGEFLPHDERFLGMTAGDLCAMHGCRVVHFMIHDRASYGGALLAIGLIYLWLAASPLRDGQAWAWWAFLLTGFVGYASFFAYLAYGYLDYWHAVASLPLLACQVVGLARARSILPPPDVRPTGHVPWTSPTGIGRICLLATATGLVVGGSVILAVGMTSVFVPEDIKYMGITAAELHDLNPRLVPLIAHDRAGFGGAVCCSGLLILLCVWCGTPSRALWEVLTIAGVAGFGPAIAVHPAIGYNDVVHVGPAVFGAAAYLFGLLLTFGWMTGSRGIPAQATTTRR
jgi:hypothetical protein